MKFRLQFFGFDQSDYERPNQKWVCGWQSEGTPCHRGPDAHGRCCGGAACRPVQNGSRWVCTRSAAAGGTCSQGPWPDGKCCHSIVACQPVRSIRARRGVLVVWTFALTTGILLLGFSRWPNFFSPGRVSSAHATLVASGSGSGCAACHTAPHNWMNALDRQRASESELCLNCHQKEAQFRDRHLALLPHGVPPTLFGAPRRSGQSSVEASSFSLAALVPPPSESHIACATCHHEHRGAGAKLASMDDQSCQACHRVKFRSFNNGHPQFQRHTEASGHSILFSHATHRDQHFGKEAFQCSGCHSASQAGRVSIASFEASCARCHSDHLNGAAEPSKSGITMLQIPALDLQTLATRKVDVGQWPRYDGDPPVRLNPFLRSLLSTDHSDYLTRLPPDLGQLSDATDDQLAAVQQLAWAIKGLLNSARTDLRSFQPALSKNLGRSLSAEEFSGLMAGLHSEDVNAAADHWFPQLAAELAKPFPKWVPPVRSKKLEPSAPVTSPGNKVSAPASDDLFNDAGTTKTPPAPKPAAPPKQPNAKPDDDLLNGDVPPAPGAATRPASSDRDPLNSDLPALPSSAPRTIATSGDGDLLNGDASTPTTSSTTQPKHIATATTANKQDVHVLNTDVAKPSTAPAKAGGDDLLNGDSGAAAPPATSSTVAPAASALLPVPSALGRSLNGWERDDEKFALIYHPTGHGNSFLRQWLDQFSLGTDSNSTAWCVQMTSSEVGGACTKCHAAKASGRPISWTSDWSGVPAANFVKFSHRPHMLEAQLQDCSACHAFPKATDPPATFDVSSGFSFIKKETCAACHAPHLASDSCLTCHNYHVTSPWSNAMASDGSPQSPTDR